MRNSLGRFGKAILLFALLVLLGIVIVLYESGYKFTNTNSSVNTPTPKPAVSSGASPISSPAERKPVSSQSGAITLNTPLAGDVISSGTTVSGTAQVFEGRLNYELLDANGKVLSSDSVQVTGDSAVKSPYSFVLNFTKVNKVGTEKGTLNVYSISAKDGSRINEIALDITLK